MKMYKLGIAGTGNIAKVHVEAIRKIKNIELVGVFSNSYERAKNFANEFGIAAYENYNVLLNDIDIIDIVSKNSDHYSQIIEVANLNKQIIVEKPMTITGLQANEVVKVCQEKNVKLTTISQHRYNKTTKIVKQLIKEDKFGNIFLVKASFCWARSESYYELRPWRKQKQEGGGIILIGMVHFIDLLTSLFGEVSAVYCNTKDVKNLGVEDTVIAILKFKSGLLCEIDGTNAVISNMPNRIEIHGTNGSVTFSAENFQDWYFSSNQLKNILISNIKSYKLEKKGNIYDQIKSFLQNLENNEKHESNEITALHVLNIIDALYLSDKGKKMIEVKVDKYK